MINDFQKLAIFPLFASHLYYSLYIVFIYIIYLSLALSISTHTHTQRQRQRRDENPMMLLLLLLLLLPRSWVVNTKTMVTKQHIINIIEFLDDDDIYTRFSNSKPSTITGPTGDPSSSSSQFRSASSRKSSYLQQQQPSQQLILPYYPLTTNTNNNSHTTPETHPPRSRSPSTSSLSTISPSRSSPSPSYFTTDSYSRPPTSTPRSRQSSAHFSTLEEEEEDEDISDLESENQDPRESSPPPPPAARRPRSFSLPLSQLYPPPYPRYRYDYPPEFYYPLPPPLRFNRRRFNRMSSRDDDDDAWGRIGPIDPALMEMETNQQNFQRESFHSESSHGGQDYSFPPQENHDNFHSQVPNTFNPENLDRPPPPPPRVEAQNNGFGLETLDNLGPNSPFFRPESPLFRPASPNLENIRRGEDSHHPNNNNSLGRMSSRSDSPPSENPTQGNFFRQGNFRQDSPRAVYRRRAATTHREDNNNNPRDIYRRRDHPRRTGRNQDQDYQQPSSSSYQQSRRASGSYYRYPNDDRYSREYHPYGGYQIRLDAYGRAQVSGELPPDPGFSRRDKGTARFHHRGVVVPGPPSTGRPRYEEEQSSPQRMSPTGTTFPYSFPTPPDASSPATATRSHRTVHNVPHHRPYLPNSASRFQADPTYLPGNDSGSGSEGYSNTSLEEGSILENFLGGSQQKGNEDEQREGQISVLQGQRRPGLRQRPVVSFMERGEDQDVKLDMDQNLDQDQDQNAQIVVERYCAEGVRTDNFLWKLWNYIANNPDNDIINWSTDGEYLLIPDEKVLTEKVILVYWKQKDYSSFARQLNIYGFRRINQLQQKNMKQKFPQGCKVWRHEFLTRDSNPEDVFKVRRHASNKKNPSKVRNTPGGAGTRRLGKASARKQTLNSAWHLPVSSAAAMPPEPSTSSNTLTKEVPLSSASWQGNSNGSNGAAPPSPPTSPNDNPNVASLPLSSINNPQPRGLTLLTRSMSTGSYQPSRPSPLVNESSAADSRSSAVDPTYLDSEEDEMSDELDGDETQRYISPVSPAVVSQSEPQFTITTPDGLGNGGTPSFPFRSTFRDVTLTSDPRERPPHDQPPTIPRAHFPTAKSMHGRVSLLNSEPSTPALGFTEPLPPTDGFPGSATPTSVFPVLTYEFPLHANHISAFPTRVTRTVSPPPTHGRHRSL